VGDDQIKRRRVGGVDEVGGEAPAVEKRKERESDKWVPLVVVGIE
jgi:hypothetical protein